MILIMKDKTVKKAKKIGGSVVVALTGYVRENKFYTVEEDGKQVILTPIEV